MSGKQPLKWALLLPPLLVAISVAVALYLQNSMSEKSGKNYELKGLNIMGTLGHFVICCPADKMAEAAKAAQAAFKEAKRVESLMSRFNPQSDISRINNAPAGEWVTVDPLTWQALTESVRFNLLTEGAFDPGIGELMKIYHFSRKEENALPDAKIVESAHKAGGIDKLEFMREGMKVRRTNSRVQIDLGAIAKGLGVDMALLTIWQSGFDNCIVEIGGEVRAHGRDTATGQVFSDKERERPWDIKIRDPRGNGTIDMIESDENTAVATSGDYQKFFEYKGKKYSHIIDPATGHPVTGGIVSASVISPVSCMQADALATSACVMGAKKFRKLLRLFPNVSAILIKEDGKRIEIKAAPVPNPEKEFLDIRIPAAPASTPAAGKAIAPAKPEQ